MTSTLPILLVTLSAPSGTRAAIADAVGGAGQVLYLEDTAEAARAGLLASARVVLSRNIDRELRDGERALLAGAALLQFTAAGVDFIRLSALPASLPVASNSGGVSEPIAEHVLAMALTAAKRLVVEHQALAQGAFNQFVPNRMLAGGVCGILGFGGIGVASARLMRAIGMKIHALNRSGRTSEPVDWIGGPGDLESLLAVSDVLVISTSLTRATQGMIGARELKAMKPDAILVNVARGEIIDEAALFAHLQEYPGFTACLDAWWIEPVRHGRFAMDLPFMTLSNVIGSPHNSAVVPGWRDEISVGRAAENCRRVLEGKPPLNLIGADERLL